MKRVFVTGGNGFIGARVVRQLVAQGCQVGVILRPGNQSRRLVELFPNVQVFSIDLGQQQDLRSALESFRPERCIHLAWYAEPGLYLHSRVNLEAVRHSLDLLLLLIETGCSQVVMAGTCAECDLHQVRLMEDGPTSAETLYAASKLSLYLMAREIAKRSSIRLSWGRIFYLYGPGEDVRRVVPALINALFSAREFPATAGTQIRDYLHVDDVASAFVRMSEVPSEGVFHVSSGQGIPMRQLLEVAAEMVGRPELVKFGARSANDWDPESIVGDHTRLSALGWKPAIDLRKGMRETVDWWRMLLTQSAGPG